MCFHAAAQVLKGVNTYSTTINLNLGNSDPDNSEVSGSNNPVGPTRLSNDNPEVLKIFGDDSDSDANESDSGPGSFLFQIRSRVNPNKIISVTKFNNYLPSCTTTKITDDECQICSSAPMEKPASLPCGHAFCWTCIAQWLANGRYCPLCRRKATVNDMWAVRN